MTCCSSDRKIPVNGGSRPDKKVWPRVPWQEVPHMRRGNVPDMEADEPDSYTVKARNWDKQEV